MKQVLVAEDSATMRKVLQLVLSGEGYYVVTAQCGDEAIRYAHASRPDIVIADLSMDGKNGYDVCSALKSDPALAGIPVLLLHGSAVVYDDAKAKAAQANGDILKPFLSQDLIDKVKSFLS
jgi:CheY-like chemotaxis protein